MLHIRVVYYNVTPENSGTSQMSKLGPEISMSLPRLQENCVGGMR